MWADHAYNKNNDEMEVLAESSFNECVYVIYFDIQFFFFLL